MKLSRIFKTLLCPWQSIVQFYKLRKKSIKTYAEWCEFIGSPDNIQFFTLLRNLGFYASNNKRYFVSQVQLPQEIYNVISNSVTEVDDSLGIAEEVIKSRMEPILLKLINTGWIDTITLSHAYMGNGVVATIMSNVYEVDLQSLKESDTLKYAYIGIAIWLCTLLSIGSIILIQYM